MIATDSSTQDLITISLEEVKGEKCTRTNIPLRVVFTNTGKQQIKILNHFEPLPVFFTFDLVDQEGQYAAIPGAGKIDFFEGDLKYITLQPGKSHAIEINLAVIIQNGMTIDPGPYSLTATYHNQYGENCFRGIAASESIKINLL